VRRVVQLWSIDRCIIPSPLAVRQSRGKNVRKSL